MYIYYLYNYSFYFYFLLGTIINKNYLFIQYFQNVLKRHADKIALLFISLSFNNIVFINY